ncbi:SDR family NAD(P)-dependent oxidoreductase [Aquimarina algicola]|uniref:SDR family NAD(P)-dependent oxidoreductase n=1 Tax=Aquimarina algicola TaxID=2589995 RepID=UPI001CF1C432|nr:SDR family NAD(P)-dependent oxidoreductase [Aquimarina algicola]
MNPNIDFTKTPFKVQQELEDWVTEKDSPRLAGISAFGAGGSNAHLIIEEYIPGEKPVYQSNDPAIIVLSAKDKDRLKEQVENLYAYVEDHKDINIYDLAYTLQVGREPMEERLAITVIDLDSLLAALLDYKKGDSGKWLSGNISQDKNTFKLTGNAGAAYIESALESKEISNLAQSWIQGLDIDWRLLYQKDNTPKKISLPTYPFAKERYWVPISETFSVLGNRISQLHPLVHSNESDLTAQKYQSLFTGQEYFLSDHVVKSDKILPGVAYLEMAREAGALSTRNEVIQLNNITWASPLRITNEAKKININIFPIKDQIGFEISSNAKQDILHCQGTMSTNIKLNPIYHDLEDIKKMFVSSMDSEECYKHFAELGITYGTNFQGIKKVWYNDTSVLSQITLENPDEMLLSPGLMDSALHSCFFMDYQHEKETSLVLPYSLKELNVYEKTPNTVWVFGRKSSQKNGIVHSDVDIMNSKGKVLVSFKDLVSLPIDGILEKRDHNVDEREALEIHDNESQQGIEDAQKIKSNTDSENSKYKEATITYLKEVLNSELKVPLHKIDTTTSFEAYGIDSISIVKMTNQLNSFFGELPPTLFFEYFTLEDLSDYFISHHSTKVNELVNKNEHFSEKEAIIPKPTLDKTVSLQSTNRFIKTNSSIPHYKKESIDTEPIAIIGLSGRYPGAKTLDEFWDNLKLGKDAITEVPLSRWNAAELYDQEKGKVGKIASKWGGFIDDVDKFDPLFFNISPSLAEYMDPQERLFLQTAWETIEDAGYTLDQLAKVGRSDSAGLGGHVGVYAGVMYGEYQFLAIEEALKGNPVTTWSSPSSIANRVSFCLNLHGPSMGVDTMCSSSLVSIHLAIDAIHKGQCSMAIAGGVNVSVHPNKYKMLSKNLFVSDKGRCESFGEGGNGYVPSEGVGAVLLKPLSQAEADGDQIYGVIKGSSLNHGGKANGYTVPNPTAQASVIQEAIARAGVSPNDFSYIEAHGTGTSLGDPIEIAGLSKAFSGSKEGQYCAIGSIKSNIGHAESAAGISGLTKVLLQLKHQQLVPSLHSQTLNPNIDFTKTPFKVQQELEDWVTAKDSPRLAGISAFGAGGSNAHLIIEEYIAGKKPVYQSNDPAIIVLSAKDKDRLEQQVQNLLYHLDQYPEINIYDLAYTLQIGREPMEERLAFTADNIAQLREHLVSYSSGKLSDLFTGNIEDDTSDLLLEGKALDLYVKTVLQEKQPKSLAQLWIRDITIDWHSLYDQEYKPKKVSLPTYPFKKVRYWIPKLDKNESAVSYSNNHLHPLLHFNNSKFNEQLFTSTYSGLEPFLTDHKVGDEKMLPGVAYLELAREAASLSIETDITQIKDIIWANPISVNGKPQSIEISLSQEGDDEIAYKISKNVEKDKINCGQGVLSKKALITPKSVNIEQIKSELTNRKGGTECYEIFRGIGLNYGASFQGIEKLWYNDSIALSKIELPSDSNYILQPGIMDSALQTCILLEMGTKNDSTLAVPFSVKEVNIYGNVLEASWCRARKKNRNNKNTSTSSYDIDLISNTGEVLLSFIGFMILPVKNKPIIHKEPQLTQNITKTYYYTQYWQKCNPQEKDHRVDQASKLILLAGGSKELSKSLQKKLGVEVQSLEQNIEVNYFIEIFQKVKQIIKDNAFKDITILYKNNDYIKYGFVSGLLKTAQMESQKITTRMIGVDSLSIKTIDTLIDRLKKEHQEGFTDVRYKDDIREEKHFKPITNVNPSDVKIKEGGVYLITGGAGGLGFVFADHISQTKNTKLILTGRSELSQEKELRLKTIPNSEYYPCDVTNSNSISKVIKNIIKTHGKLDGVIHSAGIQDDRRIVHKTIVDTKQVLAVKIDGTKNLDIATKNIPLDFFMLFSSVAGALGNVGQSDYASGNAYLDNFSKYRNQMKDKGKRSGNTYSINWPLWIDGGMHPSEQVIKYMFTEFGLKPLPSKEGVAIFEKVLENSIECNLVLYGQNIEKLEKSIVYQKLEEETLEDSIKELLANNSLDSIDDFIEKIPDENLEELIAVLSSEKDQEKELDDIEKMVDSLLEMDSQDAIDSVLDLISEDALQELISTIRNS